MTEQTDAQQGGTEVEAIADTSQVESPVQENAEDTAAQDTGTDDTGQADETGDAPAKKKPWWEKRFDELTAKRYEKEAEAAYWRGIAEGRAPQQQEAPQEVGPPDRWEDPEGYDRWLIDQAKRAVLAETERAQSLRTYEERAAKVRETRPDYDSVVNNPALRITPTMAEVIKESDVGPEVAYHLGTNPQEAARIASLPQHRQAAELGKLEVRLSQPKPAPQTRTPPPPPPQTVSGISSGINKSPEDMSMAEYVAQMKAEGRLRP
jgi:hypothetical protein